MKHSWSVTSVRDVRYGDLSAYQGKVYLGVDSGSTTTKLVLIGEDQQLLYEAYTSNQGSPLDVVLEHLKKIYRTGGRPHRRWPAAVRPVMAKS